MQNYEELATQLEMKAKELRLEGEAAAKKGESAEQGKEAIICCNSCWSISPGSSEDGVAFCDQGCTIISFI